MKLVYAYIKFEERKDDKPYWVCLNKQHGEMLGIVSYYQPWKQWVFTQSDEGIIFSASCLHDIAAFLEALQARQA